MCLIRIPIPFASNPRYVLPQLTVPVCTLDRSTTNREYTPDPLALCNRRQ